MPRFRWENFTTANGLPDNRVFNVCVDGDRVWAGTENGLGLYENGKWKVFSPRTAWPIARCCTSPSTSRPATSGPPPWAGSAAISAGRFDTFTQLNSGLANDVVYGVGVQGDYVWVATAAGASRLNTRTGEWSLFNERNTPMYEIWTYARQRRPKTKSITRCGAAACSSTTSRPSAGKTITIRTARPRWCSSRTRA